MKQLIKIKTIALLLFPLMLACSALLPSAQALITDPDETFPNFTTAAGQEALLNLTTGISNTAYGARALRANTTGGSNLGLGGFALVNNIDGDMNTAVGNNAMFSNQHGDSNMALGQGALTANVSGSSNVAIGAQALRNNTTSANTAVGFGALSSNTTGGTRVVAAGLGPNTAIGFHALVSNKTGSSNNAVGFDALALNDGVPPQGSFNNAHGNFALFSNTTGRQNNAFGDSALSSNVTGSFNTAIGDFAGAAITRNWNIDIGKDVVGIGGATGDNFVTRIGISDPADPSGHVQQKCFIGGIVNAPITGVGVVVNATGQLGIAASSARFKDEIKPIDKASEAVFALKPVTFRYKQEIDTAGTPQFGLVAEEVEKVNADLVIRDREGKVYSVRYDAVNAMLLNEFLKEHRKVEQLEKKIDALTAGLQKVRAQLELSRSAPQTVLNNQ
jgi:trimeric autotransporter adhesin